MRAWPLLLLLGCKPDPAPRPDPAPPRDSSTTSTPAEALALAGFEVGEGALTIATFEGCCDPGANCIGNNPSTPYASVSLPPSPGHAHPEQDWFEPWGPALPDGLSRTFHLRQDEAVVWLGTLPPEVAYFGVVAYLVQRAGDAQPQFGSMGPALNQLTIASERGVQPGAVFGTPFAVVVSADATVEQRVRDALVSGGVDVAAIHALRISTELAGLGPDGLADSFAVAARVAVPIDPVALQAWYDQPAATVLRLTPAEAVTAWQPFAPTPLPPRGTGRDESHLAAALDELEQAILAAHPGLSSAPASVFDLDDETYACLDLVTCSGDVSDRLSLRTTPVTLAGDQVFVVAYGPNHARTGKASYASFAVIAALSEHGVAAVDSPELTGSARSYLPDHPLADDLYAWVVARDCSGFSQPCLEIPSTCPGVPLSDPLRLSFRLYLEPETATAPLLSEVLMDRALGFSP